MIVTCVTIYVKENYIKDFIVATIENHNNSIKEKGNMRFDFLQSRDDSTRFFLYEAYESDDASAIHKKTEHYLKWRDTVAQYMAKPREGIAHNVISPEKKEQWQTRI